MNPYKILDMEKGATKRDIIEAAARAMREKKYTGRDIASAQKALINPISKAAHEFIYLELKLNKFIFQELFFFFHNSFSLMGRYSRQDFFWAFG